MATNTNIRKFQITNYKFQIGAALLITMLMIATVGALALAVGRIVISELHITTSYADSVVAYQAAEAGIERGLLEFRYNRNLEKDVGLQDIGDNIKASLKIGYKTESPDIATNSYLRKGTLDKDQSIELDISGNTSIKVQWEGKNGATGWLEWRLTGDSGSEWGIIPDTTNSLNPALSGSANLSNLGGKKTLTLKFISKTQGTINYQLTSSQPLDTGITKIESVGVYGRSQRKLVATVDRQSGQVIGIFDYTLYAGEGNINP